MKILFMGTPDIAAFCLTKLVNEGHDICGVFTREDKPVGRKQVLTAPPVKLVALEHSIPVFQPKTLKTGAVEIIRELSPSLIIVVAYGRILPKEIIDIPQCGTINLHVSKLPKYRGAAPIQWAVINGESKTGITVMYIDEGLDTGDIIRTKEVPIGENETAGDVFAHVTQIGAAELLLAVQDIAEGTVNRTPQNHAQATLAPPLTKKMAQFTFQQNATQLHNLVRGLNPWPIAYFIFQGKKIKVTQTLQKKEQGAPGEILSLKPLVVACQQDALELVEVIPEGSRAMNGTAWAAGKRFSIGENLSNRL